MRLIVLGSSSAANGYILKGKTSSLIIEAGVPFREVKKSLNFDISKIAGLILSHSHSDHSGYAKEYAKGGINVYSSLETLDSTGMAGKYSHRAKPIVSGKRYKIGEFTILPFELLHDVKNFGYLIDHPESGLIGFLTDTHYSPFIFPGLNNLLLECNYSDNVIEERVISGRLNSQLAERIKGSHMAESTMIEFLKANDTSQVNNIVIIHLSNANADANQIRENVLRTVGVRPTIATKGLEIEFNKTAF